MDRVERPALAVVVSRRDLAREENNVAQDEQAAELPVVEVPGTLADPRDDAVLDLG